MTTVDTVTVTFYTTDEKDVFTLASVLNGLTDRPWSGRVMIATDKIRRRLPLADQKWAVRAMLEDDA